MKFGFNRPSVLEKIFENGGRQTDDGPWLYYKLTNEPKGSGELKKLVTVLAKINFSYRDPKFSDR